MKDGGHNPSMKRRVAFILSDMRSGSTLLDKLLGAHPQVMSLGELHWLPAYVKQDRSDYDPEHELICTCGHTVTECVFWSEVAARLRMPLDQLQLRPTFARMTKRILNRYPAVFRHPNLQTVLAGRNLISDSLALFNCIFEVSGCDLIVDSSKSTYRFRAIHDVRPDLARGLILTRDYRAVVHSKMKRGHTLEAAAIGWRNKMKEIAALTDDLPHGHVCRLTYEALCQNPTAELTRLCNFLGVTFTPAMLRGPIVGMHHIGGSPSKFDTSRTEIVLDAAYRSSFQAPELARIASFVGAMASRWGY